MKLGQEIQNEIGRGILSDSPKTTVKNARGNKGYGLQIIARLTISLKSMVCCHHERQKIRLDAPLAHGIFLKKYYALLYFGNIPKHPKKVCEKEL